MKRAKRFNRNKRERECFKQRLHSIKVKLIEWGLSRVRVSLFIFILVWPSLFSIKLILHPKRSLKRFFFNFTPFEGTTKRPRSGFNSRQWRTTESQLNEFFVIFLLIFVFSVHLTVNNCSKKWPKTVFEPFGVDHQIVNNYNPMITYVVKVPSNIYLSISQFLLNLFNRWSTLVTQKRPQFISTSRLELFKHGPF